MYRKIILLTVIALVVVGSAMVVYHYDRKSEAEKQVSEAQEHIQKISYWGTNDVRDLILSAINNDESNPEAWYIYGQLLVIKGQYDDALTKYGKAIKLAEEPKYLLARAEVFDKLKKYDAAILDVTKCIDKNPSELDNYFVRARLLSANGRRADAIKDYDQIINRENYNHPRYKNFATVLNNKAFSMMEIGKYYEALPLLNQALQLNPKEDTYWGSRGELYYAVGDYDKSYNDFNHAIRIFEANKGVSGCDNPASYYHYRGLLHYRLGLMEAAKADLKKAVSMGSVEAAEPLHKVEQATGELLIENI